LLLDELKVVIISEDDWPKKIAICENISIIPHPLFEKLILTIEKFNITCFKPDLLNTCF
jgi:hypothetical protein